MKYVKFDDNFRALSVHDAQINKAVKAKTGIIGFLKPNNATFTQLPDSFDFKTQRANRNT